MLIYTFVCHVNLRTVKVGLHYIVELFLSGEEIYDTAFTYN